MRRALVRNVSLFTRNLHSPSTSSKVNALVALRFSTKFRLFSSDNNDSSDENPKPAPAPTPAAETSLTQSQIKDVKVDVEDVSNQELKLRIEKYFKGDEEALPSILEAILARKLTGKHEETDDELVDELQFKPLDNVNDREFESDFEEAHETDEEIDDLYNARDVVMKRMVQGDEYFNMDDRKWDEIVKEATEKGYLQDTKECEEILEDMLNWDNLLPDDIKKKVEAKFNELGDKCERQELEPEEAYQLFKEFEDNIVMEYMKQMEAEGPHQLEEGNLDEKMSSDDPPGEGPILRWKTRVVFAPGGDAWHPKNRKVKLSVTVKELGLSKHQFRRMREIVGKRYHPGRDELTITSERFEHREENRKDCLRTLLNIIEEAGKANKMAEEARALYVKERLKANPGFMARLRAKTTGLSAA
ncbi:hypothetical protein Ancab_036173 [Ancistrocladus abbreviatus]